MNILKPYGWLPLPFIEGFLPLAKKLKVAKSAISPGGFFDAYKEVNGERWLLDHSLWKKRHSKLKSAESFIYRQDDLWKGDRPGGRLVGALMWGWVPHKEIKDLYSWLIDENVDIDLDIDSVIKDFKDREEAYKETLEHPLVWVEDKFLWKKAKKMSSESSDNPKFLDIAKELYFKFGGKAKICA